MKQLIEYSAINTKIRSMHSKLLNKEDFLMLSECKTVPEVIAKLENFTPYQITFSKSVPDQLHREEVERKLLQNQYDDFSKIYRFSKPVQRQFLELFFMHYEVAMLKKILRHSLSHTKSSFPFQTMKKFYLTHSHLDFEQLLQAENIHGFLAGLQGSYYEQGMTTSVKQQATIFEFENELDQLYFRRLWTKKEKLYPKSDVAIFTTLIGTKIDLLNLLWIYRSRKYYHLNARQIDTMMIPIFYRLNKQTLDILMESETTQDFERLFATTFYGKRYFEQNTSFHPSKLFALEMQHIYELMKKKYPNSIAVVSSYLYEKEQEIENLISLIESVRYGRSPQQIQNTIFSPGRRNSQT